MMIRSGTTEMTLDHGSSTSRDSKRLIIIDDSAASPKPSKPDVFNKKLQVTSDKIKAKSGREVRARSYKNRARSNGRRILFLKEKEMVELKRDPKEGPKRPKSPTALPGPVQLERQPPDLLLEGRVPVYFQSKAPNQKSPLT